MPHVRAITDHWNVLFYMFVNIGMFCLERSIQPVGEPTAIYTSTPDRPVHSGTKSTSLGSIPAMQQLRAKTITAEWTVILFILTYYFA